ncbi:hypothetical protein [Desulfovibrio ferrophilus]|uniref:Uncharacterized protein n=1 Tax=Desulfovibrio ferrophilus TaxID=241368 RepID=A0A2Z6B3S2_9BACT|nr:hypothetical protein [Desulfovibrio ferrophilus]BBD10142.1 putative uncharacterized protein [Desulfovibrio ferrophilus]
MKRSFRIHPCFAEVSFSRVIRVLLRFSGAAACYAETESQTEIRREIFRLIEGRLGGELLAVILPDVGTLPVDPSGVKIMRNLSWPPELQRFDISEFLHALSEVMAGGQGEALGKIQKEQIGNMAFCLLTDAVVG